MTVFLKILFPFLFTPITDNRKHTHSIPLINVIIYSMKAQRLTTYKTVCELWNIQHICNYNTALNRIRTWLQLLNILISTFSYSYSKFFGKSVSLGSFFRYWWGFIFVFLLLCSADLILVFAFHFPLVYTWEYVYSIHLHYGRLTFGVFISSFP